MHADGCEVFAAINRRVLGPLRASTAIVCFVAAQTSALRLSGEIAVVAGVRVTLVTLACGVVILPDLTPVKFLLNISLIIANAPVAQLRSLNIDSFACSSSFLLGPVGRAADICDIRHGVLMRS